MRMPHPLRGARLVALVATLIALRGRPCRDRRLAGALL
jgi:hypothetical protein